MNLSLRSFHLFFIAASVALSVMVAVWSVQGWMATRQSGELALGGFFLVAAAVLSVYGIKVRKKLRDLDGES